MGNNLKSDAVATAAAHVGASESEQGSEREGETQRGLQGGSFGA